MSLSFLLSIRLAIYILVGPIGAPGSGGGLANLAASLPFPPQGQLVADYIVESSAGGISASGGSGFSPEYKTTD